ncbi:MAG TPA: hypothetical protein VG826_04195 [Pirellulales bacterium]|nr:hypothetical protein [Pirellulales bacterium]
MSRFRLLPGALILLAHLASVASAQTTLKHKFAEGTEFKTQVSRKVEQTLKLGGADIPTKVDMKIGTITSYGKADAEKNVPVETKFESVNASLSVQGMTVTFDSANPDEKAANPQLQVVVDQFRKLHGLTINYVVSPESNKVVSVERPKGETPLDPDDIKTQYQQELDMIPATPLKPGDKWEQTVHQDLGQGQVFTFKRHYEYVGEAPEFATVPGSRKLDKITATDSSVDYSIKQGGLTVKSSDLKIESSKHVYLFDREAGRMVDTDSEVRVSGKLVLSVNNMDLDAVFDLTMTTREQEPK